MLRVSRIWTFRHTGMVTSQIADFNVLQCTGPNLLHLNFFSSSLHNGKRCVRVFNDVYAFVC